MHKLQCWLLKALQECSGTLAGHRDTGNSAFRQPVGRLMGKPCPDPVTYSHNRFPLGPSLCCMLSCCLTSTEARWPIRDGDRVGRGRESERLDRGNRPKKTGETVDRRQNNGSIKAVPPRHCPATCALCNCSFNCCAGQSH